MRILLLIFSLMAFHAYCALNPPQTFSSTNGNLIINATSTTNGGLVQSNFDLSISRSLYPTTISSSNTSIIVSVSSNGNTNFDLSLNSNLYPITISSSNGSVQITKSYNPSTLMTNYDLSVSNSVVTNSTTNVVYITNFNNQIENGYTMTPFSSSGGTNYYWIDFGQTDTNGVPLIYATLTASAPSTFVGITNCAKWKLISFNVVSASGNQNIQIPDNFPHFNPSGWIHNAPWYTITLTNGNELRMTIQSNSTLSTLWQTFGQ